MARGGGRSVQSEERKHRGLEAGEGPTGSEASGTFVCLDCKCLRGTGGKGGGRDQVQAGWLSFGGQQISFFLPPTLLR